MFFDTAIEFWSCHCFSSISHYFNTYYNVPCNIIIAYSNHCVKSYFNIYFNTYYNIHYCTYTYFNIHYYTYNNTCQYKNLLRRYFYTYFNTYYYIYRYFTLRITLFGRRENRHGSTRFCRICVDFCRCVRHTENAVIAGPRQRGGHLKGRSPGT